MGDPRIFGVTISKQDHRTFFFTKMGYEGPSKSNMWIDPKLLTIGLLDVLFSLQEVLMLANVNHGLHTNPISPHFGGSNGKTMNQTPKILCHGEQNCFKFNF